MAAALLVVRASVAFVFLFAAWKNTQSAEAWQWTVNETALLFARLPERRRACATRWAAIAGMVMMYGGGFSIVLGIEPRLGGAAIAIFSLLGTRIHAIRREEAKQAADAGNLMGWSAYSAHTAAGLKNWAFVGVGVALFIGGAGRYALHIDYFGRLLGAR